MPTDDDLGGNRTRPALICFASRDGHAKAIAERVGDRLSLAAELVDTAALSEDEAIAAACVGRPVVALVAAVRYGRHLPPAERFLTIYRNLVTAPPLALASVNLTARKPAKRSPTTNPYLKKLIARHRLAPAAAATFAGRLDYPRYRWFDRQMIRFIMALTGGPTDGTSVVDYTDWASVDAFAGAVDDAASRGRD